MFPAITNVVVDVDVLGNNESSTLSDPSFLSDAENFLLDRLLCNECISDEDG